MQDEEQQLQASIEAAKFAIINCNERPEPVATAVSDAPPPEPPALNKSSSQQTYRTVKQKPEFQFRKAIKYDCKLRFGVAGSAGSGKTFTLLKLATELGGPIALVDTEHGSAQKYADQFEFDVLALDTFDPDAIPEIINVAAANGYRVLCIDGLSHFWTGKDGELDQVDKISMRSKSSNSFAAWREVSPKHNRMVDAIIASPLHVLASMRVKTEWVVEKDANGKSIPRKVGLQPIMRDGIEYEFDVCGEMDQENTLVITKSRCPKLTGGVFLKPGKEVAEILKEWLNGPPAPPQELEPPPPPIPDGEAHGLNGSAGLNRSAGSNGCASPNGCVPPDLLAIWKRMCSPRGVMQEFAKLQEAITQAGGAQGESAYQEILKRHGVQRPGEFKRSQPARLCAKELFQAIQNFPQSCDASPGIGAIEVATAEATPVAEVVVTEGQSHGN